MDLITYALCKKMVAATASGISNIEVQGSDLIFTTSSGEQFVITLPLPESGVSIVDIAINEENHLTYTTSEGEIVDVGVLPSGGEITDEQIESITQEVYDLLEQQYLNTMITDAKLYAGTENLGTPDNPAEGTILAQFKTELEESSELEII